MNIFNIPKIDISDKEMLENMKKNCCIEEQGEELIVPTNELKKMVKHLVLTKTNCINCGAPLHSDKCEYCGTEYHIDNYGQINEYKVKLNILGEEKKFYIGKVEKNSIYGDCKRNINGTLTENKICDKLRIELIEM